METKKIADFTTSAQSAARRVRGYLAGLVCLAASAGPSGVGIAPRAGYTVGRHHLGNVGHGHTSRKRASQRQRSNRRKARRAAKARG